LASIEFHPTNAGDCCSALCVTEAEEFGVEEFLGLAFLNTSFSALVQQFLGRVVVMGMKFEF